MRLIKVPRMRILLAIRLCIIIRLYSKSFTLIINVKIEAEGPNRDHKKCFASKLANQYTTQNSLKIRWLNIFYKGAQGDDPYPHLAVVIY